MCLTTVFVPSCYQPSPLLLNRLTAFAFSKRITQFFCAICGCQMLARSLADGEDPSSSVTWDLASGTLERVEGVVEWQAHGHVQDTLDGGFADVILSINGKTIPRWPGNFDKGEQLPLQWTSPISSEIHASLYDRLHGRCKCGGVQFWISRPTARSALAEKYWPDRPPADIAEDTIPPGEELFYLRDRRTKYLAGLCACNSCRLASGMEITTWAFVPALDISLDKEGRIPWSRDFGTLKQYQSSPGCYRYFCSRCGAIVFYDAEGRMWLKDIAMGLLDAAEGARAESWFGWRTSRLGYRDDAIPRAESLALAVEKGLRMWEERRPGEDLSGGSRSGGAL